MANNPFVDWPEDIPELSAKCGCFHVGTYTELSSMAWPDQTKSHVDQQSLTTTSQLRNFWMTTKGRDFPWCLSPLCCIQNYTATLILMCNSIACTSHYEPWIVLLNVFSAVLNFHDVQFALWKLPLWKEQSYMKKDLPPTLLHIFAHPFSATLPLIYCCFSTKCLGFFTWNYVVPLHRFSAWC